MKLEKNTSFIVGLTQEKTIGRLDFLVTKWKTPIVMRKHLPHLQKWKITQEKTIGPLDVLVKKGKTQIVMRKHLQHLQKLYFP